MTEVSTVEYPHYLSPNLEWWMKGLIILSQLILHFIIILLGLKFSADVRYLLINIKFYTLIGIFFILIYFAFQGLPNQKILPFILTVIYIIPLFIFEKPSNYIETLGLNYLYYASMPLVLLSLFYDKNWNKTSWKWGFVVLSSFLVVLTILFIILVPYRPGRSANPNTGLTVLLGYNDAINRYNIVRSVLSIFYFVIFMLSLMRIKTPEKVQSA